MALQFYAPTITHLTANRPGLMRLISAPGPEVIKLFPCSTQLSMKFEMPISINIKKKISFFSGSDQPRMLFYTYLLVYNRAIHLQNNSWTNSNNTDLNFCDCFERENYHIAKLNKADLKYWGFLEVGKHLIPCKTLENYTKINHIIYSRTSMARTPLEP